MSIGKTKHDDTASCQECGGSILNDYQNGQFVCRECGLIQAEKMIIPNIESTERYYVGDDTNVTHHYRPRESIEHPRVKTLGTELPKIPFNSNEVFKRMQRLQKSTRPPRNRSRRNTPRVESEIQKKRVARGKSHAPSEIAELVSDGSFQNDFLKICDRFNTPPVLNETGVLVVKILLKVPQRGQSRVLITCPKCQQPNDQSNHCKCGTQLQTFASRGDQRSMSSIRTARRWASALFWYIINVFQTKFPRLQTIRKREIADFALVGIAKMNGSYRKIQSYEPLFLKTFATDLLNAMKMPPKASEAIHSFVGDNASFSVETVSTAKRVLELIDHYCCGRTIGSVISASLCYAQQLEGIDPDSKLVCTVGKITPVTLRSNLSVINTLMGTFSILGSKNKISGDDKEWLEKYCSTYSYTHRSNETHYIDADQIAKIPPNLRVGNIILINPTDTFTQLTQLNPSLSTEQLRRMAVHLGDEVKSVAAEARAILDAIPAMTGAELLNTKHATELHQATISALHRTASDQLMTSPVECQSLIRPELDRIHATREKLKTVAIALSIRTTYRKSPITTRLRVISRKRRLARRRRVENSHQNTMIHPQNVIQLLKKRDSVGDSMLIILHQIMKMGHEFYSLSAIRDGALIKGRKKMYLYLYHNLYVEGLLEARHSNPAVDRMLKDRVREHNYRKIPLSNRLSVEYRIPDAVRKIIERHLAPPSPVVKQQVESQPIGTSAKQVESQPTPTPIIETNAEQQIVRDLINTVSQMTAPSRLAILEQYVQLGDGMHPLSSVQAGSVIQRYERANPKLRHYIYYSIYQSYGFLDARHTDLKIHKMLQDRVSEKKYREIKRAQRFAAEYGLRQGIRSFLHKTLRLIAGKSRSEQIAALKALQAPA